MKDIDMDALARLIAIEIFVSDMAEGYVPSKEARARAQQTIDQFESHKNSGEKHIQNWARREYATLGALIALDHLGYTITKKED